MSCEGYYQILCANGHYWTADFYSELDPLEKTCVCKKCGARVAWYNNVDVTNGSYYTHPDSGEVERVDGHVDLKVKEIKQCSKCLTCLEIVYYIPEGEDHA